jgi:hypothetical protein
VYVIDSGAGMGNGPIQSTRPVSPVVDDED